LFNSNPISPLWTRRGPQRRAKKGNRGQSRDAPQGCFTQPATAHPCSDARKPRPGALAGAFEARHGDERRAVVSARSASPTQVSN